jgi:hypothetical protein
MTPRPQFLLPLVAILLATSCASVHGGHPVAPVTAEARRAEDTSTIRPLSRNADEEGARQKHINALLPTARAQHIDLRTRWFALGDGRARNRAELEGSAMLGEDWRITPRLRGVHTDAAGDRSRTSFEQLRFRALRLLDVDDAEGVSFGVGADWFKDLGDVQGGTGSGDERVAPMAGLHWKLGEDDAITFTGRYFYSYREDQGIDQTRESQGRVLWVHQIPDADAWFRADYRANFDHESGNDITSTVEFQLGKLVTEHVSLYLEVFMGDTVLDTSAYDHGVGVGMRWVF